MIEKFLEDIGLSEKETKVYLDLLRVDNSSVLDLAKQTNILRTTIYPILESLETKGLISRTKIGKKIRFQAEPPERLETYIEAQKVKLNEQSKLVDEYVPQLKSLSRQIGEKYTDPQQGPLLKKTRFSGSNSADYFLEAAWSFLARSAAAALALASFFICPKSHSRKIPLGLVRL